MLRSLLARIRGARHARLALLDQALVSGCNFLAQILLVRALGLEEFGRFTLAWMAVQFTLGLQTALIVRPLMSLGPKRAAGEMPRYLAAVLLLQGGLGLALALLLLAGATALALLAPDWRSAGLALPLAAACLAYLAQDVLRRSFFTRARAGDAFALDLVRALAQLGGIAALILLWPGATSAAALWVYALASGLAVAALCPRIGPLADPRGGIAGAARDHWRIGSWLTGSVLLEWTQAQLLTVIAGVVIGTEAVGAIQATLAIVGVTHVLFEGLQNVVPIQAAARLHAGGPKALVHYALRAGIAALAATSALLLVIVAAPGLWLHLLYGGRLAGYERLLYWHALAYFLMVPALPLQAALNALEESRSIFQAQIAGSIFVLSAGWPIARSLGLDGVMACGAILQLLRHTVLVLGLRRGLARAAALPAAGA